MTRKFDVIGKEDFQCPDCKVGLMPSDEKYFFCCSCGLTIERATGEEVLPDYMLPPSQRRAKKK